MLWGGRRRRHVTGPAKRAAATPAAATTRTAKTGYAKKPRQPKGPPASELFGSVTAPAPLAARSIGSYAKGCLAGGVVAAHQRSGLAGDAAFA